MDFTLKKNLTASKKKKNKNLTRCHGIFYADHDAINHKLPPTRFRSFGNAGGGYQNSISNSQVTTHRIGWLCHLHVYNHLRWLSQKTGKSRHRPFLLFICASRIIEFSLPISRLPIASFLVERPSIYSILFIGISWNLWRCTKNG